MYDQSAPSAIITSLDDFEPRHTSLEHQFGGFMPPPEQYEDPTGLSCELSEALLASETCTWIPSPSVATTLSINRSVTSSVERLPAELLLLIIDYAIEGFEPPERASLVANTIACVCHRWRLITIREPKFWPFIASMRPNPVELTYATQAELARNLPLHLQFTMAFSSEAFGKFFRQLRPYASRWASIEVYTNCAALERQPPIDKLPLLTDAKINLQGPAKDQDPQPFRFLQNASTLQRFVVHLIKVWPDNVSWQDICFPALPNLRSFELHVDSSSNNGPPTRTLLLALYDCSRSLVDLHLDIEFGGRAVQDLRGPVVFKALRRLTLALDAAKVTLGYITAPVLEDLTLQDIADPGYRPVAHLLHLLRGQKLGNLRRLALDGITPDQPLVLLGCLEMLGGLEELRVRELKACRRRPVPSGLLLSGTVLQRLTCARNEPPLLPKLSALKVIWDGVDSVLKQQFDDALRKMTASREEPRQCTTIHVVALETVEVTGWGSR